jgi:hypothetical protein
MDIDYRIEVALSMAELPDCAVVKISASLSVDIVPACMYNTARFCPGGMCWGNRLYPGFPG